MNVGFSIPIHQESQQYIVKTFGWYEEVESMPLIENPIIHMYAKEDTLDLETGELNGDADSLFSEYHFYDTKASKVFKSKRIHDAMYFDTDVHVSNVKLFKDGSTLVQLSNGMYEISNGQAVHIYKK